MWGGAQNVTARNVENKKRKKEIPISVIHARLYYIYARERLHRRSFFSTTRRREGFFFPVSDGYFFARVRRACDDDYPPPRPEKTGAEEGFSTRILEIERFSFSLFRLFDGTTNALSVMTTTRFFLFYVRSQKFYRKECSEHYSHFLFPITNRAV